MFDIFPRLFDTSGFPPRWYCGSWSNGLGWLHILSDLGVWSAYLAIPCVLGYFVLRKRDMPFRTLFWLFGAFILACGTTHLMEAIIFWWPAYRLAGLIKLCTALVSWTTVLALIPATPKALAMRSPEELEQEIFERRRAEAELRLMQVDLEERVLQRTTELASANEELLREVQQRKQAETSLREAQEKLEEKVRLRTSELTRANQQFILEAAERKAAVEAHQHSEAMLQTSLAEKEVLLKEIHHRVKNNLQIISSLLDLQSSHTRDSLAAEMFRECQSRVHSMALVHERLHRSHDMAKVDFAGYIESLTDHLFQSYSIDRRAIRLELAISTDVRLSIDTAIPCGLLVNELVSNCLKHAFNGRESGVLRIELRLTQKGKLLLMVADSGTGLPDDLKVGAVQTFGLQLVAMLVKQLSGKLDVNRVGGTTFNIIFPINKTSFQGESAK
jgi:two-component sensor histidine kinase